MKALVLLVVLLFSLNFVQGQYKSYKSNYDIKTYTFEQTDRYKPGLAGGLAVIPGAGHCYANEALRGLSYIGGMTGSFGIMVIGFAVAWQTDEETGEGNSSSEALGSVIGGIGVAGLATFYIWSIIDATQVAKIKNMHLRSQDISFEVAPYVGRGYQNGANHLNPGLSLRIKF